MCICVDVSNVGLLTNPDGASEHEWIFSVECRSFHSCRCCLHASGLSSEVCLSLNKVCRRGLPGLLPPLLLFTCHGAIGKLLNLSLPQFMTFVQMEFFIVLCLLTVLPCGLDKIDLCKVLKSIRVLRGDMSLLSLIAPYAIFKAEDGAGSFTFLQED